jgi:tricarballylate dehydrogenase
MRGGNTRHTRNIRCAHDEGDEFFTGPYPYDEYLADLVQVTGGPANLDLAKLTVKETEKLPQWMGAHGARWQHPLAGTLHLGRTNRWFLGGGKTLLNSYYFTAEKLGVECVYDAMVEDLKIENDKFEALTVKINGKLETVRGKAVVVASGGFEANLEWLEENWGPAARNFLVRGTPFNRGSMLKNLLAKGAQSIGNPKAIHAIALDARSPKYDGGIVTRLDSVVFGVVVNKLGHRFYDEGEEIWPKRYAIWGGLILEQPDQIAYSIMDSKTINAFLPPLYKAFESPTLEGLAEQLGIERNAFLKTMADYNAGAAGNKEVQMQKLDGVTTRGVCPAKSNWALPIDSPPYYGLPLRAGITFTYMGIAVDERSRVMDSHGRPFKNVYAAGEIMTGNILTKGYVGGIGLAIGAIFGELSGRDAMKNGRA